MNAKGIGLSSMFLAGVLLGFTASSSADVVWDESVDGDLSTDPDEPTLVEFGIGSNTLIGNVATPDDIPPPPTGKMT